MPIDPATAAAAVSGVSGLVQPFIQQNQNRKNRKFAEKMYQRQHDDAVAFWNMQNAYNSPAAQMQRFKDAGLNPNLVYGRGDAGNASSVNVPSQAHWEGRAPDLSQLGGSIVDALQSWKMRSAQISNTEKQGRVLDQEALLKRAQSLKALVDTSKGSFDLSLRRQAKKSLLLALQSSGAIANANANYQVSRSINESTRGKLLEQSYAQLSKLNPIQLNKLAQGVQLLRDQHKLNAANLQRLIKSNRLIGVSDKTEIGSLVRAILTMFNIDPSTIGR